MSCRVYAHVDLEGHLPFVLPIDVARPADTQFGTLKQELINRYTASYPDQPTVVYESHCFWNDYCCPIADRSVISLYVWEHNDFFLRQLPAGLESASGALTASQEKRGELSYYYAHNQPKTSLVSKPKVTPATSSTQEAVRKPVEAPPADRQFNYKQSPFGTDITGYETITSYTWEDHDGDTVKVLIPLDGVGKLAPESIRSHFDVRAFELLIDGYNGKKLRFATSKAHGEMRPADCKHVVRANRVNLVLKKAKEKDIWFDLFKKRAIGDDDDP